MGTEAITETLGQLVKDLADVRAELRELGTDEDAIRLATERLVRQRWPFVREWKHLCQRCGDYGLEMLDCPGNASCGRSKPHLPHEYGQPCWCSAGAKFRPKQRSEADFQEAGKVTKPKRSFSRFGS